MRGGAGVIKMWVVKLLTRQFQSWRNFPKIDSIERVWGPDGGIDVDRDRESLEKALVRFRNSGSSQKERSSGIPADR